MYGIPADLDLSFLHGAELIQIRLGVYDVQFSFDPIAGISTSDSWSLFDENGVCIDHGMTFPRPPFQLHRLLGQHVTESRIAAPTHLELIFERGERLRLSDTSERFESFTIDAGADRPLIVV
jgi:hypothetical protein